MVTRCRDAARDRTARTRTMQSASKPEEADKTEEGHNGKIKSVKFYVTRPIEWTGFSNAGRWVAVVSTNARKYSPRPSEARQASHKDGSVCRSTMTSRLPQTVHN